jgi:hypothetical protein
MALAFCVIQFFVSIMLVHVKICTDIPLCCCFQANFEDNRDYDYLQSSINQEKLNEAMSSVPSESCPMKWVLRYSPAYHVINSKRFSQCVLILDRTAMTIIERKSMNFERRIPLPAITSITAESKSQCLSIDVDDS